MNGQDSWCKLDGVSGSICMEKRTERLFLATKQRPKKDCGSITGLSDSSGHLDIIGVCLHLPAPIKDHFPIGEELCIMWRTASVSNNKTLILEKDREDCWWIRGFLGVLLLYIFLRFAIFCFWPSLGFAWKGSLYFIRLFGSLRRAANVGICAGWSEM